MIAERTAAIDLHQLARSVNVLLLVALILSIIGGTWWSFWLHFLTVPLLFINVLNGLYLFVQRRHTLLRNFGILGQARYFLESIGPEMRQYLFANDNEERPFSRIQRSEVYRKSYGIDSASAFGSQMDFASDEITIRHSMFPTSLDQLSTYRLTVGEERGLDSAYTLKHHIMISAMSYGALSAVAVEALARGAAQTGIIMNTGEGGYPKYHLRGGADLTFQLGTAKFGVRHSDSSLDEDALAHLCGEPQIKMVEIKLSQGAKPGKGGLLPKEKISPEIAALRKVSPDQDVISPPGHVECVDIKSTVAFIRRVQEVSGLPTGIKLCLGSPREFADLVAEMRRQNITPDFITVDGAEGGTGAAPGAFMDGVGMPLLPSLWTVHSLLQEAGLRQRLKLFASGKLINPGRQLQALCLGADACYTARGFMLAVGCIQALQCHKNTCPVGITSHDPALQRGFVIAEKARRVANYVHGLEHECQQLVAATGVRQWQDLSTDHLYLPELHPLTKLITEPFAKQHIDPMVAERSRA